jgi:transcriptional regulator with XRE-family HTH domain
LYLLEIIFLMGNWMSNFAEYLKNLRTEKRMGVRELGRAVDVTGMHISNMEKGKSLPSPELIVKLAKALDADVDEMSYQADHIAPEVVDVIQNQPKAVPNFLRSAKDLTPEQWKILQQQLDSMVGDKGSDDS